MPYFLKDRRVEQFKKVKDFYIKLKESLSCEVFEEDESFSTRMSEKIDKNSDDSLAAAIILQSFIDRNS